MAKAMGETVSGNQGGGTNPVILDWAETIAPIIKAEGGAVQFDETDATFAVDSGQATPVQSLAKVLRERYSLDFTGTKREPKNEPVGIQDGNAVYFGLSRANRRSVKSTSNIPGIANRDHEER